jgi:hypothetical protein
VKKSMVWTTAAIAAVGFGVPAFAAISGPVHVKQIAPTPVVSVDAPDWTTAIVDDTSTSVPVASIPTISLTVDSSSTTDISVDATDTSAPDNSEDVSGNCDEAEHANDANCTGGGNDDNSGPGSDDSGHGSDNSGHGDGGSGGDDSGHGGNDG